MKLLEELAAQTQRVEHVLRGQRLSQEEINAWAETSQTLYEYVASDEALEQFEHTPSTDKTHFLEVSVKLFNKLRNLSSSAFNEIKCMLKGTCAWIFSIFADKNAKVLSVMIKTFNRCGSEFATVFNKPSLAVVCFNSVVRLWEAGIECNSLKDLPPLEVSLLKECVFHSLLLKANDLVKSGIANKEMTALVSSAIELSQSLSIKSKLVLANHLVAFGKEASAISTFDSALKFFEAALRLLDSPTLLRGASDDEDVSDLNNNPQFLQQVADYKVTCYLCSAFIFSENKDIAKASACIDAISSLQALSTSKQFHHTIVFAKLMVAINQNQLQVCLDLLHTLLQANGGSFEAALSAVKKVAELMLKDSVECQKTHFSELFKLLALKFPSDPELTIIRINHLQTALAAERLDQSACVSPTAHVATWSVTILCSFALGIGHEKAHEIAARIVSDHVNGIRRLNEASAAQLLDILIQELVWLREQSRWRKLNAWCDLFIQFIEGIAAQEATLQLVRLEKIDALLQLKDFAVALSIAYKTLVAFPDSRSAVMFFQCLLHYEDISKTTVVEYFLKQLSDVCTEPPCPNSAEDLLHQLTECCAITEQTSHLSHSNKVEIVENLVLAWLTVFLEKEVWKLVEMDMEAVGGSESGNDSNGPDENSFFDMLSTYLHYAQLSCQSGAEGIIRSPHTGIDISGTGESNGAVVVNVPKVLAVKLRHVVTIVKTVIDSVCANGVNPRVLGPVVHVRQVADFLAGVGYAPVDRLSKASLLSVSGQSDGEMDGMILDFETSAFFFEASAYMYGHLPVSPSAEYAEVLRCRMNEGGLTLNTAVVEKGERLLSHISQARQITSDFESIQRQLSDYCDDEDMEMAGANAVFQFSTYCLSGTPQDCESFIHRKRGDFLNLPTHSLEQCIELASASKVCSLDTLRVLIGHTLQASLARATVPYPMVGSLYRRLLELSPSRRYALERVQEIEQLLRSVERPGALFCQEDVDCIFALAYNYGIALLDLDQLQLAEQFINRTFTIAQFVSPPLQAWIPKMHDMLATIHQSSQSGVLMLQLGKGEEIRPSPDSASVASPAGAKGGPLAMEMFKAP